MYFPRLADRKAPRLSPKVVASFRSPLFPRVRATSMQEREGGHGRVTSVGTVAYLIVVEVVRPDWVADWYAEQVRQFVELRGLQLADLSRESAVGTLALIAGAMERAGYSVKWRKGNEGFTLNNGGVLAVIRSAGE